MSVQIVYASSEKFFFEKFKLKAERKLSKVQSSKWCMRMSYMRNLFELNWVLFSVKVSIWISSTGSRPEWQYRQGRSGFITSTKFEPYLIFCRSPLEIHILYKEWCKRKGIWFLKLCCLHFSHFSKFLIKILNFFQVICCNQMPIVYSLTFKTFDST